MDINRVREIEEKIADLKARWPAHSVPPSMWQVWKSWSRNWKRHRRLERKINDWKNDKDYDYIP